MTAQRLFSPADPPATTNVGGLPYSVSRRVFARVPCLVELPSLPLRGLCIVYHGAGAAKEGKLGVYSALTAGGVAVVIPDAPLHGERALNQPGLNAREFVWESARRSVAEAEAMITVLSAEYGKLPVYAVGSSMGGYVALSLARSEKRLRGVAALITSGVWQEPDVNAPGTRAFLEGQRPITHAGGFPPMPLFLASGDRDPTFPLETHHEPTAAAFWQAYEAAGCLEKFSETVYPEVSHYTSKRMRDDTVTWLLEHLNA